MAGPFFCNGDRALPGRGQSVWRGRCAPGGQHVDLKRKIFTREISKIDGASRNDMMLKARRIRARGKRKCPDTFARQRLGRCFETRQLLGRCFEKRNK
jgi:hypothetical protein